MAPGGRARRGLVVAAFMTLLLPGTGARAATYSVSVSSNTYSPTVRQVAAGDTILWVWANGGHNVTSISGATFASGDRAANATYTQTFPGGVVKYRCTNHSSVVGGECDGMCGLITEKPLDFTPPLVSITRPSQGQIVVPTPQLRGGLINPVMVEGTANDNVGVLGVMLRLYDTTGRATDMATTCIGCPDGDVQWRIEINPLPGTYVAEARATDTSGNIRWSSRTSFTVL